MIRWTSPCDCPHLQPATCNRPLATDHSPLAACHLPLATSLPTPVAAIGGRFAKAPNKLTMQIAATGNSLCHKQTTRRPGPRQLAIGIATALKVRLQPAGACTVGSQGILINDFRKESIRIPSAAGINRVAHTLSGNLQLAACNCCKLNPVLSSLAQLCDTCGSITAQKMTLFTIVHRFASKRECGAGNDIFWQPNGYPVAGVELHEVPKLQYRLIWIHLLLKYRFKSI